MSLHRSVVAAALAATLLTAGCSDDSSADPTPVTAGPTTSVAPTTTAGIETTTTTAQAATSTTTASPPVTKPLTTAPPSELLTEVTAAYDAAWDAVLAAAAIPDENFPGLSAHIGGGQLARWQELIRGARSDGVRTQISDAEAPWRRVEEITVQSPTRTILTVCRFDAREDVDGSGEVVNRSTRPYRYAETLDLEGGEWKWTGREWIDGRPDSSDCALQ